MAVPVTCLLTIHGIGFQQAPDDAAGIAGYADALHRHLRVALAREGPALLGDDPQRPHARPGEHGPIYVQSRYQRPDRGAPTVEGGLSRLGTWSPDRRAIDARAAPLASDADVRIAHVALIYADWSDLTLHVPAGLETLATAADALRHGHYQSALGLARALLQDGWALAAHPARDAPARPPGLRVRRELAPDEAADGALTVLNRLQHDLATYVCRNDLRERVRDFVAEALLRLCARDDVAGIVVNAHSQGTTVAFDVLRRLPEPAAARMCQNWADQT